MPESRRDGHARAFVRAHTALRAAPLVPEIALHLADEVTPLWRLTARDLAEAEVPPPFWAFAWPGGQALARLLLDRPDLARGRRVLDFAAGCGIAAIAAARAGAAAVRASDIDRYALAALALNAARNRVRIEAVAEDLTGRACTDDLILAGDVCYERAMAARTIPWLRACAAAGASVLLADPGRTYLPPGLAPVAAYDVPTSRELEDGCTKRTLIYRLGASPGPDGSVESHDSGMLP